MVPAPPHTPEVPAMTAAGTRVRRHEDRHALEAHVVRLAALAGLAGAVAGLVVGGVGGRLAMRLVAAASGASAQGVLTDDGARVGTISAGGTLFLLTLTTALGVLAGVGYFVVRPVLPAATSRRVAITAAVTGAVGGAVLLGDHTTVDFGRLEPEWFAVPAFVALPALAGATLAALTERWLRPGRPARRRDSAAVVAGVLALLLVFPVSLPVVLLGILTVRVAALHRLATTRAVRTFVLGLLAVATLWGVYGVTADVVSIATDRPSTVPLSP